MDTQHWRVGCLRIHSAKGDVTRSCTMEKKDIGVVVCCRQPSTRKVDYWVSEWCMIYLTVPFPVTLNDGALDVLCAQRTRDLFAIAKFLCVSICLSKQWCVDPPVTWLVKGLMPLLAKDASWQRSAFCSAFFHKVVCILSQSRLSCRPQGRVIWPRLKLTNPDNIKILHASI